MAIQQLTQPIVNPIAAFDATKKQAITFVVIGGAQVVGNRLIIRNNQTGEIVYNQTQSSMKLEHILPANSLKNNNFYNAVIYTIDNGNDESVASVPIPFYCYTQPALTIDNIPSSGTIENGTYSFQGNYVQNEGELLNSYRFTLYDSNKTILAQSPLIYYNTDPSLTYLFSGMSNNTSYYIELTGETINSTILTSGVKSFTVRYIQPASFAICDLVNDCENGYIQISSNIVAIDGKSNPTPPKYIDDKEVDLREPDSWVEWDSGFSIKNDFTLRAWGRDFNPYEPIITLSNQQNTSSTPNKIEMKWMIADVLKVLPDYKRVSGQNINLNDSKAEPIEDIYVGGNTTQYKDAGVDYGSGTSLSIPAQGKVKPLKITVNGNQYQKTTQGINLLEIALPTQTYKGVTFTNNGDGSFTLNGTATADLDFRVEQNAPLGSNNFNAYKGTYTFYCSNLKSGMWFGSATYDDGAYNFFMGKLQGNVSLLTREVDVGSGFFYIHITSGTTVNKLTLKPMFLKGAYTLETIPKFEPYTGGKPSPSTDYPQEIETVGDNVQLLDNPFINGSANGISWIINDDGTMIIDGTTTANTSIFTNNFYINAKEGETVTLSATGLTNVFNVGYKNLTTGKDIFVITKDNPINTKTLTADDLKNANRFHMYIQAGKTFNNQVIKIKLEKGTKVTPYSPYGQGSVKVIKQNKNFLYYEAQNQSTNGINFTVNSDKSIQVSGTATAVVDFYLIGSATNYESINLQGAYKINGCNSGSTSKYMLYVVKKSKYGALEYYQNVSGDTEINIAEGDTFRIFIRVLSGVTVSDTIYPMLRLSTETDDTYVEAEKEEYIIPVQQEMLEGDYIDGTEHHTWKKAILKGDEGWGTSTNPKGLLYFNTGHFVNSAQLFSPVISNMFQNKPLWTLTENEDIVKFSESSTPIFYCMLSDTSIDTVNKFTALLKSKYDEGNPVIIYYKLATPINLALTEEQSNIQSQLTNNSNYLSQTNLSTDEDLAILKAKYPGTPSTQIPSEVLTLGNIGNIINISDFNITYSQGYSQETNTGYEIKPNFLYTLSYYFDVNEATTDLYFSVGYGKDSYEHDINSSVQYVNNSTGRNIYTFIAPSDIPEGNTLWVKFAKTIIQADINVDIRNIELENRGTVSDFQQFGLYNVRLRTSKKNLFNYKSPYYILTENISLSSIQNGYAIEPAVLGKTSYLGIGWQNTLNPNKTYAISYFTAGELETFELYTTKKGTYEIIDKLDLNEGVFTMPDYVCDLQLRFYVASETDSDNLQIWNIQIEPDKKTEFEVFEEEGGDLLFDKPLNGIGKYHDLVCLESPNLLNPTTQEAKVKKGTDYYISQTGNISCVIDFINEDGNLIKKETYTKGTFKTPDNCTKLQLEGIVADTILTNKIQITEGTTEEIYYPYVSEPSLIRYISEAVLTGGEGWSRSENIHGLAYFDTHHFKSLAQVNSPVISNMFLNKPLWTLTENEDIVKFSATSSVFFCMLSDASIDITAKFTAWLKSKYDKGNPAIIYYVLKDPVTTPLTSTNVDILKSYSSYDPITNVFVDNTIQGNLELSYVNDYTEQETQNAYVLLRCYNQNNLPYIIHSNYIDIPKETDKVFIWTRRKNNIFDLKIENLGDYSEPENPDDPNKPVVTLEIQDSDITSDSITVTASSIDNLGLTTVRFSKNNGDTWDEIVQVDGLSSINTYTFTGLTSNTLYTIRVEAIDTDNNVGGISQQVRTKI